MWSPQGRLTWLFCQMASKALRIKQSLFLHWGLSTEAFIMSFYYLIKENANFAWCHLWIVLLQKIISRSFQFSKKIFFFFSFPSLGSQTSCWERRSTQRVISQIWSYTAQGTTLPRVHQQQHISCSFACCDWRWCEAPEKDWRSSGSQTNRLQRRKSNKITQGFGPKTPMVCKIFYSAFILFEMFLNMVKYLKVKMPLNV